MKYNIKITNDSTPQAKNLLMMLRTLAMYYDFLQNRKGRRKHFIQRFKARIKVFDLFNIAYAFC